MYKKEGNRDVKMRNKAKKQKSGTDEGLVRTKNEYRSIAKQQQRELTPMIGSIPKRQIKGAPKLL